MQPTKIAAALIASAVLLMSSTPLAHAQSQDDVYLKELRADGVTQYPPDKLIKVGHLVCAYKAYGAAPWQAQYGLMGYGIAPQDIDAVATTAVNTYCP
jgi:Protein of unknown function (DUF732)